MGGSQFEDYKPCIAMVLVQCFYALVDMALQTVYTLGMSPIIFVAYRQGIAALTLLLASMATKGWELKEMRLGMRAFGLVFIASLASAIGQYLYFQGLHLASPSMARATTNLSPGITFSIAALIGLERVDLKSSRTMAKIVGTIICLGGAILMAFFKGPKLLNVSQQNESTTLATSDKWVQGGFYLVGNAFCVSIWYILQVPVCKSYLDPLSLATWMCLLATLQSAVLAFFLVPDYWSAWKLTSLLELPCILYGGIFASGANFFLQSWCISVKGPLYSAIFTPLSAVITTVLSTLFLHEQLHIGSLFGAVAVIGGLYVVLWGKAEDLKGKKTTTRTDDFTKMAASTSIVLQSDRESSSAQPLVTKGSRTEGL